MKFCQPHWEKLREAIRVRGLYGLVAKSGEEAMARTVAELETASAGEAQRPSTFDPLMGAHWAIVNNVGDRVGILTLMAPNEDGSERCPLCYIQTEHDKACHDPSCGSFDRWVEYAADGALAEATKLGLVGSS